MCVREEERGENDREGDSGIDGWSALEGGCSRAAWIWEIMLLRWEGESEVSMSVVSHCMLVCCFPSSCTCPLQERNSRER